MFAPSAAPGRILPVLPETEAVGREFPASGPHTQHLQEWIFAFLLGCRGLADLKSLHFGYFGPHFDSLAVCLHAVVYHPLHPPPVAV